MNRRGLGKTIAIAALLVAAQAAAWAQAAPASPAAGQGSPVRDLQRTAPEGGDGEEGDSERGFDAAADSAGILRGYTLGGVVCVLACLWFVAYRALGRKALALFPLLPLVISPFFPAQIVARPGDNIGLMAWLCAFLAVWAWFHNRGRGLWWPCAVTLGFVGGVCAFAKVNGAAAVLAYAGYAIASGRGRRRFAAPAITLGTAVLVLYILNPSLTGYRPGELAVDIFMTRLLVWRVLRRASGPLSYLVVLGRFIPSWPLTPLFLLACWCARRARWFAPVAWWGAMLVGASVMVIDQPCPHHLGALELGLYFPAVLSFTWLCIRADRLSGPLPQRSSAGSSGSVGFRRGQT